MNDEGDVSKIQNLLLNNSPNNEDAQNKVSRRQNIHAV